MITTLFARLLPMKWPLIIMTVLGMIIGSFLYGVGYGKAKENTRMLAQVEAALEEERSLQVEQRRFLDEYYKELMARNVRYEVVNKEVVRYVEKASASVECLDDDGVRVVERILSTSPVP